jgi:hypothetical protein
MYSNQFRNTSSRGGGCPDAGVGRGIQDASISQENITILMRFSMTSAKLNHRVRDDNCFTDSELAPKRSFGGINFLGSIDQDKNFFTNFRVQLARPAVKPAQYLSNSIVIPITPKQPTQ